LILICAAEFVWAIYGGKALLMVGSRQIMLCGWLWRAVGSFLRNAPFIFSAPCHHEVDRIHSIGLGYLWLSDGWLVEV